MTSNPKRLENCLKELKALSEIERIPRGAKKAVTKMANDPSYDNMTTVNLVDLACDLARPDRLSDYY